MMQNSMAFSYPVNSIRSHSPAALPHAENFPENSNHLYCNPHFIEQGPTTYLSSNDNTSCYDVNMMYEINGQHCVSHANSTVVPFVRVVKRRSTANKKERRRTQSINNAYADLRDVIPNVPADTKLSKIKTLRLATSYINYLVKALESDVPTMGGFTAELAGTTGTAARKSQMAGDAAESSIKFGIKHPSYAMDEMCKTRKIKGRTGWPEHVWALELKQEQSI